MKARTNTRADLWRHACAAYVGIAALQGLVMPKRFRDFAIAELGKDNRTPESVLNAALRADRRCTLRRSA